MSNLRRAIPLLRTICKNVYIRDIHTSRPLEVVHSSSPRVSGPGRIRPGVRVKKTYDVAESLPPVDLLHSAHKAGALDIDVETAMVFLHEYKDLSETPGLSWVQKLCSEHNVTPSHMAILASILNRCHSMAQKSLGKKVMLSASELGEKSATFELISSAIRTGSIQEYQAPLRRLGILAKRDGDPQAMLLLGKVLYGQRGDSEALSWFQKATRPPTGTLEFNGASEALVQEGRILLSRKDHSGARKAFLKAALELDDPTAYFYLSKLEEFGSPKQEVYLTKASTSGIPEAWHNLGAIELARDTGKAISGMKDYGMAREWFLVAASDGFGLSMLNLALMHKSVGEVEEGLEWLEKAEELVEVADEARSLKRQWTSEQVRESDS